MTDHVTTTVHADHMDFVIRHSYLIPLLPLIGAAVAGFFGRGG